MSIWTNTLNIRNNFIRWKIVFWKARPPCTIDLQFKCVRVWSQWVSSQNIEPSHQNYFRFALKTSEDDEEFAKVHHAIINTFEPYFAQWSENPSEKVKKIVSKKSVHIFRQLLDNIFNLTCEVLPTVHRDLLKVRYTIKMNNHFFFTCRFLEKVPKWFCNETKRYIFAYKNGN